MKQKHADKLYELADLIHAVARRLTAPADLKLGPCTPVEINVMRFISKNPGTSVNVAATATLLFPSNLSRVLKSLIAKGLLRREVDDWDARTVRLYPTELARANMEHMRDVWSQALAGMTTDMATVELANTALRRIETELASRSPALGPRGGGLKASASDRSQPTRRKKHAR